MNQYERTQAVHLLFSRMVEQMDDLREQGVRVPSDVYVSLGMLQGNIEGIVEHIAVGMEDRIMELTGLDRDELIEGVRVTGDDFIEDGEEEEEELPTRMDQVRRTAGLSPLERRKLHVVQKDKKD